MILWDFGSENRYPEMVGHLTSVEIEFCSNGCMISVFFPQHHMFKSLTNKEYFTENLIPSQISFMAMRSRVIDMGDDIFLLE
jgi:hypothetical protein